MEDYRYNGERGQLHSQFLEVAVGYIVATPIGHGIELDTMGELHLFPLTYSLELDLPLMFPSALTGVLSRRLMRCL